MGSVYIQNCQWYLRYKDSEGHWRGRASKARNKTEAKFLLTELERSIERQRFGLEQDPKAAGTLADLLNWWLETYSRGSASHEKNVYAVRKHFFGSELENLLLPNITSGKIEIFLQQKCSELAPQTVNHLRRFVLCAFNCARRAGRYTGVNPVTDVKLRKIAKRKSDYLRADEVPKVLCALEPQWRPLFATAIYTGLRKGELFALQKVDVDLSTGLLTVMRSHDRDTTKSGRAEVIPIANQLVPFLQAAMAMSSSSLVFPGSNGNRFRADSRLSRKLRIALGRAGIVEHYTHICRRPGCHHRENATDNRIRRCPKDNSKMWPTAVVRKIRFHDLRHTTASLLMMAGANPASVQRIMRHSNPKMTTEVYGHLAPGYLKSEINRLQFDIPVNIVPTKNSSFATYLNSKGRVAPICDANND